MVDCLQRTLYSSLSRSSASGGDVDLSGAVVDLKWGMPANVRFATLEITGFLIAKKLTIALL
ncbi:hypothetical protein HNP60_002627 [Sphingobium sp. B1D3A]|uniref:Uncharacterized protein n=1 Tax=Sphingobium lignivorans TaxID=2735886 RepID=A0ABR6NHA3_9SPHN|nr:hypothetical protein [Sphingobium lignivorans]